MFWDHRFDTVWVVGGGGGGRRSTTTLDSCELDRHLVQRGRSMARENRSKSTTGIVLTITEIKTLEFLRTIGLYTILSNMVLAMYFDGGFKESIIDIYPSIDVVHE
jgi:hypothetical protein